MIRKLVPLAILTMFVLVSGIAAAETAATVTTTAAAIRQKNSPQSTKLMQLRRGERIEILKQEGRMVKVKYRYEGKFELTGWMSEDDIGEK